MAQRQQVAPRLRPGFQGDIDNDRAPPPYPHPPISTVQGRHDRQFPSPESGNGFGSGARSKGVYLHTAEFPFGKDQPDVQKEAALNLNTSNGLSGRDDVPLLTSSDFRQVNLIKDGPVGSKLRRWDIECATKHLAAIESSVVTPAELQGCLLASNEGETAVKGMDLAGIANAPGIRTNIAQRCRIVLTSHNRIVFSQVNHTAEVGVPTTGCLFSLIHHYLHERWSIRRWTSFYAAIDANEVVEVFVQQTLKTSYLGANCACADLWDIICCSVGGALRSDKNLLGVTQTLSDHDQVSKVFKRHDKTRFMRHSLVIRYLDHANGCISQTVAVANADVPPTELYQLARLIEACKTLRAEQWFSAKSRPTPGSFGPYNNEPPSLYVQRRSYLFLVIVLGVLGLILIAASLLGGIIMAAGAAVALQGVLTRKSNASDISGFNPTAFDLGFIAKQGVGGAVYVAGLVFTIANKD